MVIPAMQPAVLPSVSLVAWNVLKSNVSIAGRFAAFAHSVFPSVSVRAVFSSSAALVARSVRRVSRAPSRVVSGSWRFSYDLSGLTHPASICSRCSVSGLTRTSTVRAPSGSSSSGVLSSVASTSYGFVSESSGHWT